MRYINLRLTFLLTYQYYLVYIYVIYSIYIHIYIYICFLMAFQQKEGQSVPQKG